jgi:hypothetical protein
MDFTSEDRRAVLNVDIHEQNTARTPGRGDGP